MSVSKEKRLPESVPLETETKITDSREEIKDRHIRFPSCRLMLAALGFFGFLNIYCLRVDLSVAIVAMANSSYTQPYYGNGSDETKDDIVCEGDSNNHTHIEGGEFNWNFKQQGIILASFFYGYITTQIPGGILAQRVGGKVLMLFGVAWTAILTIFTPLLTKAGDFAAIVAVRVLEGIGEGVTYPSMHAIIAKWAPPNERSKIVTFVYAGCQIGTVLAMPLSGLFCDYMGWESVFYIFGALGVLWSIMWFFLIYDSPSRHPRIQVEEKVYIEACLGDSDQKRSLHVPWLEIIKSPPVYAVAFAHMSNNWGYYTLLTCLPMYFKYILKFDIKSNGFISGIPYLMMWLIMVVGGQVADILLTKKILHITIIRKLFLAIGFLTPAVCLIITGYVNCNAKLAVVLIVIAVGVSGLGMASFSVNHLDLAPPYASTLMGITNALATVPGFVGPSIVGAVTYKNQTRAAWRIVFYITAGVYLFGTIFFCVFGSGERQKWATEKPESSDLKERLEDDAKKNGNAKV